MTTQDTTNQIQQHLLDTLGEAGIVYGQAVSICSIITEMKALRVELDDIASGLYQRFNGEIDHKTLKNIASSVLESETVSELFQMHDDGYISLTPFGIFVGNNWLQLLKESE
jgi:hypothetical protein